MTNVIFDLVNSQDNTSYSKIWISPVVAPVSYNGSLVVGDTVIATSDSSNPVRTVSLVPNQYSVRCLSQDAKYQTEYYIAVPELNGGTIEVADITTGSYTTGSWITMSYAAFSGTASYALTTAQPPASLPDLTDDAVNHYIGINNNQPQYALDVNGVIGNSIGIVTVEAGNNGGQLIIAQGISDDQGGVSGGDVTLKARDGIVSSGVDRDGGSVGIFGGKSSSDIPIASIHVRGSTSSSGGDISLDSSGPVTITSLDNVNIDSAIQVAVTSGNFIVEQGNVGVQNPNPSYTLDVNGDVNTSGGYYFNGGSFIRSSNGDTIIFDRGDTAYPALNVEYSYNNSYLGSMLIDAGYGTFFKLPDAAPYMYIVNNENYAQTLMAGAIQLCGYGVQPNYGYTSPYLLDVAGDINLTGNLYQNGETYVPNNAVTASLVQGSVVASLMQLPCSSSLQSLTPNPVLGSAYFQVTGSKNLLYVHNGVQWCHVSLTL